MRTFLSILLATSALFVLGQSFTKQQTLEDLQYLKESIKTYEPGLKHFPNSFNSKADSLIAQVGDSMDLFEYFSMVSAMVASAEEAHFSVGDWQDTVHQGFLSNIYTYLPLAVKVLNEKIYVWSDLSDLPQLKRGDEIVSINGSSITQIMNTLKKYLTVDGNIQSYPDKRISDGFNWLYYLYIDQSDDFRIRVKSDGVEKDLTLESLTLKEMKANSSPKEETAKDENPVYELHTDSSFAILKLKSFNRQKLEDQKLKARTFYKELFKSFSESGIEHLVIDLRDNFGGRNEFADDILPFILSTKQDGAYRTSISWKGKEKVYKYPKPHKYAFEGRIYVLVNAYTYSAAATLARYFNEYANAVIIGEETGSRYGGYAAGSSQSIVLSNSGIKIGIPRYVMLYPPSTKQATSNRGLLPQHKVNYSFKGLLEDRDKHLELAERLIRNK